MAENKFFQSPIDKVVEEAKGYRLPSLDSAAPRSDAQSLRSNGLLPPSSIQPIFEEASATYGVPLNVLAALAQQESSYNDLAVGPSTKWGRAKGIMQYLDSTAKGLGINPFDPRESIPAAARQLRERLDKGYTLEEAIMAHHGGDNRKQWGEKTRAYARQVLGKAGKIGEGLMASRPAQEVDLDALQAELDAQEPGRYRVLSPAQAAAMQGRERLINDPLGAAIDGFTKKPAPSPLTIENQQAATRTPQAPSPLSPENQRRVQMGLQPKDTRPYQGFLEATGSVLSNVPERFQQSIAGLIQMAGEDMGRDRERYIADRARQYGITPGDMKLLAWAGNMQLIDPKTPIPQALEYVKKNIAPSLNEQQLKELSAAGIINPDEITAYAKQWREDTKKTMDEVRPEPGSMAYYGSAAIGSIAEMAPMIAGAILTRSPAVAMGIMSGQVGGQSYAEAREKGLSEEQAQTYAVLTTAADAAPEALVVGRLLKPGAGVAKKILEGTVLEGAQEAVTAALQAGIDQQMIEPDMTLKEALVRIRDGAIVGAMVGGGMGGAFATADAIANRGKRQQAGPSAPQAEPRSATPAAATSDTTPQSEAQATPAAPVPEQVAPAPVNDNAAPEAPQPPRGPLSRAAERVTQSEGAERVRVQTPIGEIAGTMESFEQDTKGGWQARILGDDGQFYQYTDKDGVQIAPEAAVVGEAAAPQAMPEPEAVEQQQEEPAAVEAAEAAPADTNMDLSKRGIQDDAGEPTETSAETVRAETVRDDRSGGDRPEGRGAAGEVPAGAGQAAGAAASQGLNVPVNAPKREEKRYEDMTEAELRERLKYLAQQAKTNGGWDKLLQAERKKVEKAINARVAEREAPAADQATVKDETPATPEQPAADQKPVKWFGTREKADAFIAKKGLTASHEVVQTGKVRFEVKPKAPQAAAGEGPAATDGNARPAPAAAATQAEPASVSDDNVGTKPKQEKAKPAVEIAGRLKVSPVRIAKPKHRELLSGAQDGDIVTKDDVRAQFDAGEGVFGDGLHIPTEEQIADQINALKVARMSKANEQKAIPKYEKEVSDLIDEAIELAAIGRTLSRIGTRKASQAPAGDYTAGRNHNAVAGEYSNGVAAKLREAAESAAFLEALKRRNPPAKQGAKPEQPKQEKAKPQVSKNTIFTDEAAERARAVLRSKLTQLNSGIDPEVMQAGITLAGWHIERGARAFADFARAMIEDMGEAVRPYLKSWYLGAKFDPRTAGMEGLSTAAEVEAFDLDNLDGEAAAETTQVPEGETDTVVTPSGREIEVRYKVVEADDLIPSNLDDGRVNPDYPQELQPRNRSKAASELQVNNIAAKMNPRLLGESASTTDGAPIVSPEGVVESGNGRTMAILRAYRRGLDSAQAYRDWLASQGYDVAGMRQPVLVRERVTPMGREELIEYTRESNARTTMQMSPEEQAKADGEQIGSIIDLYAGGDIANAANRPFVRAFIDQIVPQSEQGDMVTDGGALSIRGRKRIEAALMHAAYGDTRLVADLFVEPSTEIKTIGGAMLDSAASWLRMRNNADPSLDVTQQLVDAVNIVRRAREEGKTVYDVATQMDVFSGATDPVTMDFLGMFFRGDRFTRQRSREVIADMLYGYATGAEQVQPGPDMFGMEPPGAQEILRSINEKRQREEAGGQQGDIFAGSPQADDGGAAGRRDSGQGPRAGAQDEAPQEGGGQVNVPSAGESLERDRANADAREPIVPATDGNVAERDAEGAGVAGDGAGQAEGAGRGDQRVPANRAATRRERGNKPVHRADGQFQPSGRAAGDTERAGGRSDSGARSAVEQQRETAVAEDAHAPGADDLNQRLAAQRKANKTPTKWGDKSSIDASLPLLLPEQREDVYKAEKRLDDNNGILFTNGTGTGKTATGLGIAKRFINDGKDNIIIVVPSDKIAADWVKFARMLGIKLQQLEDTNSNGKSGPVVTTYANFGQNRSLVERDWDLVITDESHYLSSNENGDPTAALDQLRALTGHHAGFFGWVRQKYAKEYQEYNDAAEARAAANGNLDIAPEIYADLEAAERKAEAKWRDILDRERAKWDARWEKQDGLPKTVFLSATPFAYAKNTDYAEGYLFHYVEPAQLKNERGSRGYNQGGPRERFMMQHFGYRMRYNKLTAPEAGVNSELMEQQFNEWLKSQGALSGRRLEVPFDYDRKFVLVDDAVGTKIDEALKFLRESDDGRYREIYDAVMQQFDYQRRMYLLESMKARAAVPIIREHMAAGRKVVVFHDFNKGGGFDPFRDAIHAIADEKTRTLAREVLSRPMFRIDFSGLNSPIETMRAAFPDALFFNGTVPKQQRRQNADLFNDDNSGRNLIVVQSDAGREGVSLHDTTGKHQRVMINLGMPVKPVASTQIEGRIYRTGQASNAIFRYLTTGTAWEAGAFASKIAERASTAENLALGSEARGLKEAFIDAYVNAGDYPVSQEDGRGGKDADRSLSAALTVSPFERAKTFYWAQQKNTKRRDQREGVDYFATPEPVGFKMVEWANIRPNEKVLEPSAGHGAIARFFPEQSDVTMVEPSYELSQRAGLANGNARIVNDTFESLHINNKYDAIVMNPPYGVGGKTAIEHMAKAAKHLREGGRIVALIPRGGMADRRLEQFLDSEDAKGLHTVAKIDMPAATFERAGTSVNTQIVVLEKHNNPESAAAIQQRNIDLSDAQSINELFDRLENLSLPERVAPADPERLHEIVEHITAKGKKLRGIIRTDLTADQAKAIDPYTFRKKNGAGETGWFIRSKYLDDLPESTRAADLQSRSSRARYSVDPEGRMVAEFGPIIEAADAADAISKLKDAQTGEAIVVKPGIGEISLVYGNRSMGLAHIEARRGEAMLERLPDLIENGTVYTREGQNDRLFIGNDRDEAVIRLDWNSRAKTWLLTAYEKHPNLEVAGSVPRQGARSQVVAERAQRQAMTTDQVRQAITRGVNGKLIIDTMVAKGLIQIHPNTSTLPKELGRGKRGIQAVTAPDNRIHLVASNLTPQNANAVLLHEMFHSGVENLVGSKRWAELMGRLGSLYRQAERSSGKAREIMDRARARVADAKAQGAVATRMEVEEFGAYMIEEYESLPAGFRKWVDDLVGAIKAWLFSRYGKQLGNVTPAQLRALAHDALINVAMKHRGELFGKAAERFSSVKVTESPAFKRWFGDSKAVDFVNADTGAPIVSSKEPARAVPKIMYHTTLADFEAFEVGRSTVNSGTFGSWDTERHAIFVTPDINSSQAYGTRGGVFADGANVMPLYIKAENPLDLTDGVSEEAFSRLEQAGMSPRYILNTLGHWEMFDGDEGRDVVEMIKAAGYDSVIFNDENPDTGESFESWAVFRPEQIKSAIGNVGTFDPANPDIRFSVLPDDTALEDATKALDEPAQYKPDFIGQLQQDIGRLAKILLHPRQIAALHKDFAPVYRAAIDQFEMRDAIIDEFQQDHKAYDVLPQKSKKRVNAVLELGRLLSTTYSEAKLREGVVNPGVKNVVKFTEGGSTYREKEKINALLSAEGEVIQLSEAEIQAYLGLRKMFDKALDKFKDQTLEDFGFPELVGQQKAAGEILAMIDDTTPAEKAERLQNIARFIQEIEQAKRTGYVPFARYGDYVVAVKEQQFDLKLIHDPYSGGWIARDLPLPYQRLMDEIGAQWDELEGGYRLNRTQRQALMKENERTIHSAKVEFTARDRLMMKAGRPVEQLPSVKAALAEAEKWKAGKPNRRIVAFEVIQKKPEGGMKLSDVDALAEVAMLDNETWDAVRDQLADAIKGRSFRKHFFQADNVPGYTADFERAIADYMAGMAGYLSRRHYNSTWDNAIAAIKAPRLFDYANKYRAYANEPQEELAMLRQVGFFHYIAGVPATAFVNLTQPILMTIPVLGQIASMPMVMREMTRAYKDALAMIRVNKRVGLDFFDPSKAPADIRPELVKSWGKGMFVPLQTYEVMATARQRNVGHRQAAKFFNRTIQVTASLFSFAERLNRLVTFIAAARLAKKPGVKARAMKVYGKNALARQTVLRNWSAESLADFMIDETQFRMGKANRPVIMRGVGAAIMQFKGFVMQSLEAWFRLATQNGKEGVKAVALSLGFMVLIGGLWGLPGADDLRDLIEKAYKQVTKQDLDLKTELRRYMYELTGQRWIAEVASKGATYPFGLDLSRVGMGGIAPDSPLQVFGIPADLIIGRGSRAFGKANEGDYYGAVAEFLPNFLKNPVTAYGWTQNGVRDGAGRLILDESEVGSGEVGMKSLGFQPSRITDIREYTYAQRRMETANDELKRDYASRLAKAIAKAEKYPDKAEEAMEEYDAVLQELEDHNARFADRPEYQINITRQTLNQRIKREMGGAKQAWGRERKQARGAAADLREVFGLTEDVE